MIIIIFVTLKIEEENIDAAEKDLVRLKYVLYKNLSTIISKKNSDHSNALDFLIQVHVC